MDNKSKEEIWNEHISGWKLSMTKKGHYNALQAMESYARQQAIAFIKYNCPDIQFDDTLLDAGYTGFLSHQYRTQNTDNQ